MRPEAGGRAIVESHVVYLWMRDRRVACLGDERDGGLRSEAAECVDQRQDQDHITDTAWPNNQYAANGGGIDRAVLRGGASPEQAAERQANDAVEQARVDETLNLYRSPAFRSRSESNRIRTSIQRRFTPCRASSER